MLEIIEGNPKVNLIIEAVNAQNISTKELAEKSGLAPETVSRILHGKQNLTLKAEQKLFEALRLSEEDELFEGYVNYKGVTGYIEFNGSITKITSLQSLIKQTKAITTAIGSTVEEAKRIKATEKANSKKLAKFNLKEEDIDLFKAEVYDAEAVKTWSFCKSEDVREGIANVLGNMCQGFPFVIEGEEWLTSESAYIAGMFSNDEKQYLTIQRELQAEGNGYAAKKEIRHKYEAKYKRADWEQFNVQWMLYVVWQKCKTNERFAELLTSIPKDAILIENSTAQNGATSGFWGAKNEQLLSYRDIIEQDVEIRMYDKSKKEIDRKKMIERNKVNSVGQWHGVNCMGKILKICQLSLLSGIEPRIDYDLLRSKQIFILGKLMRFEGL